MKSGSEKGMRWERVVVESKSGAHDFRGRACLSTMTMLLFNIPYIPRPKQHNMSSCAACASRLGQCSRCLHHSCRTVKEKDRGSVFIAVLIRMAEGYLSRLCNPTADISVCTQTERTMSSHRA